MKNSFKNKSDVKFSGQRKILINYINNKEKLYFYAQFRTGDPALVLKSSHPTVKNIQIAPL